jgi:hypothetical protein
MEKHMSKLADDLCAEVRRQCEQAEHFKALWMQANDELEMSRAAERTWETSMMQAIGEDGVGSVADAIAGIKKLNATLLAALKRIVTDLSDNDEEGLIEHTEQMMQARAAIAQAEKGGA